MREDWFGLLNWLEEVSREWIGRIILLCRWTIGKVSGRWVMHIILNSSEDTVPLAMGHCSPVHKRIPENSAILLKIYWLYSPHSPLPDYLSVWRWFSTICRWFTILFWLLHSFWDTPGTKPAPLWECSGIETNL